MAALAFVFLMATAVEARAAAAEPPSISVLVPVVGSVAGIGVVWKTDVELRNDTSQEATVALSLPAAVDEPTILLTLPAGGVQRFTDVVGEAFGMAQALSPLRVQTLGRHSIRVIATVYGVRGADITKPEPIPVIYSDPYYPLRRLDGLSFSDDFRTNIGLANLGEKEASFTLALQRVVGRNVAVARVTIPRNALWHQAIQAIFPLITKGDDFTVIVETGSHDTYVYGSVIDNRTSDARFIPPALGAPPAQDADRQTQ
ncbi:MAG: hypothetical protein DMF57_03120 [Acidobacteria bacterium]|nr:MAG: hypothetical protein DMF57_03120 [Acidobacteriota bacterium]